MKADTHTPQDPQDSADLIDFPELVRTLNAYKWGVLALTFLGFLGACIYVFSATPIYRGTASVLIEAKNNQPIKADQEVYDPGTGTTEYYYTQYLLMKSRSVEEVAVDRLNLTQVDEFNGNDMKWLDDLIAPVMTRIMALLPQKPVDKAEQDRVLREKVIATFNKKLDVAAETGSQLVDINFDSRDPKLAAEGANAVATAYIENAMQARLNIAKQAVGWLSGKLGDIRGQLEDSERQLQDFRDKQNLVNVGGERNLLQEQMVDNAKQLRDTQNKVTELANSYAKIQAAGSDPSQLENISTLLLDPVVQRANASYLDAQESYRQDEKRYGPKHPLMQQAQARLDTAKSAYYEALRASSAGVKAQYEIAQRNAEVLSHEVSSNQGQLKGLDDKSYQASVLQRDSDTNRELYDMFLKQFKETDVTQGIDTLNARVVDSAVVPIRPAKPKKLKIILLATGGGLLAGILLALLRHLLSEEIRSPEDLELLTRMPVLGILPLLTKSSEKASPVRTLLKSPRSAFAESVRSLQTALVLPDAARDYQRLMITSSIPGEGKSTLAACLAAALGSSAKVLLVEADLSRPSLGRSLGVPLDRPGLTQLLAGQARLEDCLLQAEDMPFSLLLAGKPRVSSAGLLSSEAFASLVEQMSQHYDRIIFDCPPCQAGADALVLSNYAQAVLFVVKSADTTRRMVKHSVKRLRLIEAPLLGTVINQVDFRRNYSHYAGYYLSYD